MTDLSQYFGLPTTEFMNVVLPHFSSCISHIIQLKKKKIKKKK